MAARSASALGTTRQTLRPPRVCSHRARSENARAQARRARSATARTCATVPGVSLLQPLLADMVCIVGAAPAATLRSEAWPSRHLPSAGAGTNGTAAEPRPVPKRRGVFSRLAAALVRAKPKLAPPPPPPPPLSKAQLLRVRPPSSHHQALVQQTGSRGPRYFAGRIAALHIVRILPSKALPWSEGSWHLVAGACP